MRRAIGARDFKQRVLSLDAGTLSDAVLASVQSVLKQKADSFEPQRAQFASKAAAPLAAWVKAAVYYRTAFASVQPLLAEVARLDAEAAVARGKLDEQRAALAAADADAARAQDESRQLSETAAQLKRSMLADMGVAAG
jgi:hypothetical protein